jgi:hypothetical protein
MGYTASIGVDTCALLAKLNISPWRAVRFPHMPVGATEKPTDGVRPFPAMASRSAAALEDARYAPVADLEAIPRISFRIAISDLPLRDGWVDMW